MQKLIQKVKEDMDKKDITVSGLARKSGIAKSVITDGISIGKTKEMQFDNFLQLIPHVYEDYRERREAINQFMLASKKILNLRKGLCYCLCVGELDITEKLLAIHANNTKLKKYLTLYRLLNRRNKSLDRGQNRIDLEGIDKQAFAKSNECAVLINILYDYSMYDAWDIQAMEVYIEKETKHIETLEEGIIKHLLLVFSYHRTAYIDLHHGRLESAREKCSKVLESPFQITSLFATALCCIGESYIFSEKEKSEEYLLRALNHLEEYGISKTNKKYFVFSTTLSFVYIIHGWKLEKIDFVYLDRAERGLFEGLHGDLNKGLKILEEVVVERPYSPYGWFYLAYVKKDIKGLRKALEMFEGRSNYHYATAVRMILKSIEEG